MDKFVLHRVPESQGLYAINIRNSTHELMAQIVQFCVERMEVE